MNIRLFKKDDLSDLATVHQEAFPRQRMSSEWIHCNAHSYPETQIFVAEDEAQNIRGYIFWCQKSGFRPEVVLELKQLAVLPSCQGQGTGEMLIRHSLPQVQKQLQCRGAMIKHIIVTTRADNFAQKLYRKTLNVEIEATVKNLYSADEVFMVARDVQIMMLP